MPAPNSQPLWQVVDQRETTGRYPDGTVGPGLEVMFVTVSGKNGTVFVPRAQLSLQKVRELVSAHAQLLEGIGQLSA